MGPRLTKADKRAVEEHFPGLNCEVANQRIWGTLEFCYIYNPNDKILTPTLDHDHPEAIADDYEIEILFNGQGLFGFPEVYETSSKIEDFAASENLPIVDLHLFPDRSCCLGIFSEYQWKSAYDFILKKVVNFFYWQSHRRIRGEEPWPCYSHTYGHIQAGQDLQARFIKISALKLGRNDLCHCGTGQKYKICCYSDDEYIKHMFNTFQRAIGQPK